MVYACASTLSGAISSAVPSTPLEVARSRSAAARNIPLKIAGGSSGQLDGKKQKNNKIVEAGTASRVCSVAIHGDSVKLEQQLLGRTIDRKCERYHYTRDVLAEVSAFARGWYWAPPKADPAAKKDDKREPNG